MFVVGNTNHHKYNHKKIIFRFFYLAILFMHRVFVIKTYFPSQMHWYLLIKNVISDNRIYIKMIVVINQPKLGDISGVQLPNAIRLSITLTFSFPGATSSTTLQKFHSSIYVP